MYAYQDLESERDKRARSAEALGSLKFVKADLNRLTTIGDLIFGNTKGLNSYLAKPASSQVAQINVRIKELSEEVKLNDERLDEMKSELSRLTSLFMKIHRGEIDGNEYDRYDESSFKVIKAFREVYKASKQLASADAKSLEQQRERLESIALLATIAYFGLIIMLTWWSNRSISKPVSTLSVQRTSHLN